MVVAALLSAVLSPAFAQSPLPACKIPGDKRCAVDEGSLVVQAEGPGALSEDITPPPASGVGSSINLDVILNTALKIWDIIVKNKPVVDVKTQYATALPQGVTSWGQLANWQTPEGTVYGFYAKNGFGQQVINVRYLVTRMYGGSYKGKGKYLTAVAIEPLTTDVAWGYKFSLAADTPPESIGNFGSDEDPVAGMQLRVKWTIETAVKTSMGTSVYFVKGDGMMQEDGSPFPHGLTTQAAKLLESAPALRLP